MVLLKITSTWMEKRFVVVFCIQSVLIVSSIPKAFSKFKSENLPRVVLVDRKGRCFSFLWVYRQIYKRFLTNQSACCVWLGYVMSVYDIFQNLKRSRVPMSCRSLTFIRSADHSRSKMTPDISL